MEEDKELYREFLKGNENAFKKIVLKYSKNLIYFIFKYVKNIEVSEDLSQDVFLYLIKNKEKFKFKCSLKTYLKKNKISITFDENILDSERFYDIEEYVFNSIGKKELIKEIGKLKENYGKAVYLADIEEFSYKEIARILGKTIFQVKNYSKEAYYNELIKFSHLEIYDTNYQIFLNFLLLSLPS